MGNITDKGPTNSKISIDSFLLYYASVCEINDDMLGRLKVYRKTQINYDYVAITSKVLEHELIQDCQHLMQLCDLNERPYKEQYHFKALRDADLWLRVFSYEVEEEENRENLSRIKICMEYLNFSLKEYILQGSLNSSMCTSPQPSKIPKEIAFIIGSVIEAYLQVRSLYKSHSFRSIQSILLALTNPEMIYLNVEGALKFLPLPIFSFSDSVTGMDKCLIDCCRFAKDYENNGKGIVVPRYTINGGIQLEKLDKLFLSKIKKMLRQIEGWILISSKAKGHNDTEETTTYFSSMEVKHARNQSKDRGLQKDQRSNFWEIFESQSNLESLCKLIEQVDNMPSTLDFSKSKANDLMQNTNYQNVNNRIRLEQKQRTSMGKSIFINDLNSYQSPYSKRQNESSLYEMSKYPVGNSQYQASSSKKAYNREYNQSGGLKQVNMFAEIKCEQNEGNVWNYRFNAPIL